MALVTLGVGSSQRAVHLYGFLGGLAGLLPTAMLADLVGEVHQRQRHQSADARDGGITEAVDELSIHVCRLVRTLLLAKRYGLIEEGDGFVVLDLRQDLAGLIQP